MADLVMQEAAFLAALAEHGIRTDTQELLVRGNPDLGIPPGSLKKALAPLFAEQQLVARIKRSSKYFGQTPAGKWFDVRIAAGDHYCVVGNSNRYRTSDVAFGVRLADGSIVELT